MATMIKSSADTQNQLWAGDKSRFGFKMLEKMGWSEGKGLGTKEDGQTSHVKMKMKTNTLGVGADVGQNDRWNTVTNDYAGVLAKLSAAASPQKAGKDKAKKKKKKKDKNKGKDKAKASSEKDGGSKMRSEKRKAGSDESSKSKKKRKSDTDTATASPSKPKKTKKKRIIANKRQRMARNVSNYSSKDLAEIFGGSTLAS